MRRNFDTKANDDGNVNIRQGNQDERQQTRVDDLNNPPFGDNSVSNVSINTQGNNTPFNTTSPFEPRTQQFQSSTIDQSKNLFQFQSRAQSSTSSSQMSTRIKNGRDARKGLFLERLRSSRRDERDERNIEKFEKSEYWREKRMREERMAREAEMLALDEGVIEDDMDGLGGIQDMEEMSPVDEETELGALVDEWYQGQEQYPQHPQQGSLGDHEQGPTTTASSGHNLDDDFMDANFDFEDPDVEEVFMQVLSQQQQDRGEGLDRLGSTTSADIDRDMEMS